ncbi:MAG: hypothetical protein ACI4UN_07880 [Muribaculaceae bacterium]
MTAQNFAGGTGTAADPYQVATAEQLNEVSNFPTACFIQTADIDLSDIAFEGIAPFTGVYDGNGYSIDYYSDYTGSNGVGLFKRLHTPGVIKNVTMKYADVVGGNWSGILCSTNGNWEKLGGDIINCTIYDSFIEGADATAAFAGVTAGNFVGCRAFNVTVEGGANTGGISGQNEGGGRYKDCTFYGNVNGSGIVGGICAFYIGVSKWDYAFENCVVYGNISSSTGTVAGVLGQPNWDCESAHIINSAVFADISGQCVGSFGGNSLRGKLQNCYATGSLRATGEWTYGPWNGGLCASNFNGPVEDCYFSGTITATAEGLRVGAICGRNWPGITVARTYYNSDGASMGMGDYDDPATYDTRPLLPEEMLNLDNFDFSDKSKWQIAEGTTPFLANQTAPLTITECTEDLVAGTGETDLEFVYIYGSLAESVIVPVTIDAGNWSAEIPEDVLTETETVTVIGIAKDKMPSMVTKAKVLPGSLVEGIINNGEKTVKAIYNVAGQRIAKIQQGQINIVKYSDGSVEKVIK